MNDTKITTVEALAAGIAADIRQYGHYQAGRSTGDSSGLAVCVVLSGHYDATTTGMARALADRLGLDGRATDYVQATAKWNDSHTTTEVLAALDSIAAAPAVVAAAEAARSSVVAS